MRTIRMLEDNCQRLWTEGSAVKLTFTGVRAGKEYIGRIKTIGVNMMTVEFWNGTELKEEQLMDLHTIKTIDYTTPLWEDK